jgi:hypothetical protein
VGAARLVRSRDGAERVDGARDGGDRVDGVRALAEPVLGTRVGVDRVDGVRRVGADRVVTGLREGSFEDGRTRVEVEPSLTVVRGADRGAADPVAEPRERRESSKRGVAGREPVVAPTRPVEGLAVAPAALRSPLPGRADPTPVRPVEGAPEGCARLPVPAPVRAGVRDAVADARSAVLSLAGRRVAVRPVAVRGSSL